jgi:hypothetical protein
MQTTNIDAKAPERHGEKEKSASDGITERTNRDGNLTETTSDWRNIGSICNVASWTSGLFATESACDRRSLVPGGRRYKKSFGRRAPAAFSFRKLHS